MNISIKRMLWPPQRRSGLWDGRGDPEPNHGESVRDRSAGHPSQLQEALRALAALGHRGKELLHCLNSNNNVGYFTLSAWKALCSQGI